MLTFLHCMYYCVIAILSICFISSRTMPWSYFSSYAWYDWDLVTPNGKIQIGFNLCQWLQCRNLHTISPFWTTYKCFWLAICVLFHRYHRPNLVSFMDHFGVWFTRAASLVNMLLSKHCKHSTKVRLELVFIFKKSLWPTYNYHTRFFCVEQ